MGQKMYSYKRIVFVSFEMLFETGMYFRSEILQRPKE